MSPTLRVRGKEGPDPKERRSEGESCLQAGLQKKQVQLSQSAGPVKKYMFFIKEKPHPGKKKTVIGTHIREGSASPDKVEGKKGGCLIRKKKKKALKKREQPGG